MRYHIILPVVVAMSAATFAGCRSSHEGHNNETEVSEEGGHAHGIVFTRAQAEAAGLITEVAESSEFHQVIRTSGQIQSQPGGETVIAATSSGIVSLTEAALTEGAAVAKGQTIVTISAQNLVDGDPAARARIEYGAAEREYRRAEELVKDRIISERDFNEVRRRYETARAALPSGTTGAGVRVESPVAGYVKNLMVARGEHVAAGQPIVTVAANDKLRLRAEVSERYFGQLPDISKAHFRIPYSATVHCTDKLLSYGRAAEGAYIPIFFEFTNVDALVPGTFADVWLLGRPMQDVLSVPKSALTEEQGLYFVYVQHGEEDYARQEVTLGVDDGERIQITGGVEPGDRVVIRGAAQIRLAASAGVIPEGHSHSR